MFILLKETSQKIERDFKKNWKKSLAEESVKE